MIKLARALEGAVRSVDLVCRLGGEEFALILQGTDAEVACEIAGRIRGAAPGISAQGIGMITVSIGIATGGEGTTAEELFERADAALMAVKRAARTTCASPPAELAANMRLLWRRRADRPFRKTSER